MKKYVCVATGILLALALSAQIKITAFGPESGLTWTNLAAAGLRASPIYQVDRSSSPTGSWETLTNTSQTSMTNIQPIGPGPAVYRVTWTNGQVWSYEGYSSQSLVSTGTLYVGVSQPSACLIDGGAYNLAPGSPYRSGHGELWEGGCGLTDYDEITFAPFANDDYFWIEVTSPGADTWTGNWHWDGFALSAQGPFVARRMINGH